MNEKYFTAKVYVYDGRGRCEPVVPMYELGNYLVVIGGSRSCQISNDTEHAAYPGIIASGFAYLKPIIFYMATEDIKMIMTEEEILSIIEKIKNPGKGQYTNDRK